MLNVYSLHIKELLRNKYLILTNILIPILLYPFLFLGFQQFMLIKNGFNDNQKVDVNFVIEDNQFNGLTDSIKIYLEEKNYSKNFNIIKNNVVETRHALSDSDFKNNENNDNSNPNEMISVDVKNRYNIPYFTVNLDSTNSIQLELFSRLEYTLKKYQLSKIDDKIKLNNLDDDYFKVFNLNTENIFDDNEVFTKIFSMIIPLFSIIFVLAGAMAFSVEITAGERENNATETLYVTPLNRIKIFISKILVVTTFSFFSGLLNFTVLGLVMLQLIDFLLKMVEKSSGIISFEVFSVFNIYVILLILLSLIIIAFLCSTLFVTIASFAKTKKEANVVLTPVMTLLMYSSFITFIPAIEPSFIYSIIPVLNISMAIKSVISGDYNLVYLAQAFGFSILHIILTLKYILPLAVSENVIFGTGDKGFFKTLKSTYFKKG